MTKPFVLAWHFLTAIPLSRRHHDATATDLAASMAWYSTVGLMLGGLLAAADWGLRLVLTAEVVNGLLVLLLVLVTRGLHQDGLADTVDGLAGGRTPEDRLRIMRDPNVGAFGATGLCLSLLLRYVGLLALPSAIRLPVLLCMPALGRWAMVSTAWSSPYARQSGGLAAPFLAHLSWQSLLLTSVVLLVALAVGFGGIVTAAVFGISLLLVSLVRMASRAWLGGITGDVLGATNELVEIVFVLLIPLAVMSR